jgi:GAF domain-containing protein
MAVPLLIGEKVVGVLDMQSEHGGSLSTDILPAFEALAGQVAIAIQNANFLAETQQARAEVESQARRLTRANWVDYLDAVHKPEETGYIFEQNKITSLKEVQQTQTAESNNALVAPITVTGESLGNLVVEMEGQSPIARTDELINTVARQVAQQIESLRLLDTAERYRTEAEQASRRLTLEGWKTYASNANESMSYFYDLKEVLPYNKQNQEEEGLTLPLKVHDETIGKLVIQGLESNDIESMSLANAVVERLGAHIENLRLSEQSQGRAQRERALRQITSAVRGSTDPATILRSAARELGSLLGRKTIVRLETARAAPSSPADLVKEANINNGNKPASPAESQNAIGGDK